MTRNLPAVSARIQRPAMGEERFASVEYDRSYLQMPLNWRLRLWGQSVGGYGVLNGKNSSRYATKAQAETAAAIWMATGTTPAHQTDAQRKDYAARNAAPLECAA